MSRVLITGGCGFIGSNLIELLRRQENCEIRVIDNESTASRADLATFDVDFISGDIQDVATLERALRGIDLVVHLAADTRVMDSIVDPENNFRTNVIGTFNLLTLMRRAGIHRIVNASTGGAILGEVEPPVHEQMAAAPLSPYGASKLSVEGYCSAFGGAYGFSATSLRFSNVYGPRSYHKGSVVAHFFKRILSGGDLTVYGDGSQTRDFVFVEDLCAGIVAAMRAGQTGVFQLGSGVPTTVNELIACMRELLGERFSVGVRYEPFREGELRHTWCDISKARQAFQYDPATSLAEGLARTWAWFRASMDVRVNA